MDPLRRPPAIDIDITWVSCRGVRSPLPFHTPCLHASVCVTSSARKNCQGPRVRTPTDRAGGENPEWDECHLRLQFPDHDDASSSPASPEPQEATAGNSKKVDTRAAEDDDLVVKFELKAEVAFLGDVLAASAVVPLADLVADGRTRRVSYQLSSTDASRHHNGVISFSYAYFQQHGSRYEFDGEPVAPPPCPVASPAPAPSSGTMYPAMDWPSMEQLYTVYPPLMKQTAVYPPLTDDTVTITRSSRYYYYASTPPPETPVRPAATRDLLSARGIYPMTVGEPDNGLYPTVDLDPVICYPPTMAPCYGGGSGYPAVPYCDDARCLYS